MKKSEAAKLVNKWINDRAVALSTQDPEEQCIDLLDFLVNELGMKPPYRAVGPFEENFTWEPEDENSQQTKIQPTPLTPEELADVYANDEDLQKK